MWTDSEEVKKKSLSSEFKPRTIKEIFKATKNQVISVFVEYIINGSTLKVQLPEKQTIVVHLYGINCPSIKKGEGDVKVAQPFAMEALAEAQKLLQQEVLFLVEDYDEKYDSILGTILKVPLIAAKNTPQNVKITLQEELLEAGFAQNFDYQVGKSRFAARFMAAENEAMKKQAGVWKGREMPKSSLKNEDKKNFGNVVVSEVLSGDLFKIINEKGEEERVSLSHVRAPRSAPKKFEKRDEKKTEEEKKEEKKEGEKKKEEKKQENEPFYQECKDVLKKAIQNSKKITMKVDYRRDIGKKTEENQNVENRRFVSLYVNGANVALTLVKEGLAFVSKVKAGEERSLEYPQLLVAEQQAAEKKAGVHGNAKNQPTNVINDISFEAMGVIEKHFQILKGKKLKASIEKVFSGSRYKITLPNDYLGVFFSMSGLNVQPNQPKRMKGEEELISDQELAKLGVYGKKALSFAIEKLALKSVEITIDELDKSGAFLGRLYLNGKDFALAMLESGSATLRDNAKKMAEYKDYENAENIAKAKKAGIWEAAEIIEKRNKFQAEERQRKYEERSAERQKRYEEQQAARAQYKKDHPAEDESDEEYEGEEYEEYDE